MNSTTDHILLIPSNTLGGCLMLLWASTQGKFFNGKFKKPIPNPSVKCTIL